MSKKIVGIDLGTTFSAIAMLDSIGNPEILPDLNGDRITASAVYLASDPSNSRVGVEALAASKAEPTRVITEIKSHMRDECVYSVSESKWIDKAFNEKKEDEYSPSQLASKILEKLKGFGENIDKAVITVPAMFANQARDATLDAAKIAGLSGYQSDAVELINEPTAAIFHYANLPGASVSGKVMVYDLGGGTFDVTIAEVKDKNVQVINSEGNPNLGGKDIDRDILEFISKKYNEQLGSELDLNDLEFLLEAEKLKKALSVREAYSTIIDGPNGPSKKIEVTRSEFNKIIEKRIDETSLIVKRCLKKANIKPEEISEILLVGGSTRIPAVVNSITKIMGKAPTKGVNVDEAVAAGAALYAGKNADQKDLNAAQQKAMSEIDLKDVANHYFGTLAVTRDPERDTWVTFNSIIINKGDSLPASNTEKYQLTSSTGYSASVTQSTGKTENKEFVHIIKQDKVDLENAAEGDELHVTYSYDKSQNMHCSFHHVKSGKKFELEIKALTSSSVDKAQEEMKNFEIE